MNDIRPRSKRVEYDTLLAEVDYKERSLVLTNKATAETITIPADAYGELHAIMSDIGRPIAQQTTTNSSYRKI
jgi:hypothetical protein